MAAVAEHNTRGGSPRVGDVTGGPREEVEPEPEASGFAVLTSVLFLGAIAGVSYATYLVTIEDPPHGSPPASPPQSSNSPVPPVSPPADMPNEDFLTHLAIGLLGMGIVILITGLMYLDEMLEVKTTRAALPRAATSQEVSPVMDEAAGAEGMSGAGPDRVGFFAVLAASHLAARSHLQQGNCKAAFKAAYIFWFSLFGLRRWRSQKVGSQKEQAAVTIFSPICFSAFILLGLADDFERCMMETHTQSMRARYAREYVRDSTILVGATGSELSHFSGLR